MKRKINKYRVVSPLFGEWLYGLPRGWTDCRAKVKASTQHGGGMLKSFDTFTGIGGLALSAEDFFKPIAYCEMNNDCVSVPSGISNAEGLRAADCGEYGCGMRHARCGMRGMRAARCGMQHVRCGM